MVLCTTASGKAIKSKKVQCFKRNGTRDQKQGKREKGREVQAQFLKRMGPESREAWEREGVRSPAPEADIHAEAMHYSRKCRPSC
jgi:hypothetical protein